MQARRNQVGRQGWLALGYQIRSDPHDNLDPEQSWFAQLTVGDLRDLAAIRLGKLSPLLRPWCRLENTTSLSLYQSRESCAMAWKLAGLMGTPSTQNAVPKCQACSEVEDRHG